MKPTVSLISEEHQRAQNYIEALQNKNTATILSNLTFPTAKTGDFGTIFETNSQAIGGGALIGGLEYGKGLIANHSSSYGKTISNILNHSIDVHNPYYFRDYILSHFTGRKLEQIAIFHAAFVAQQYAADSTNQEVYDEISRSYKLDGITPFFYNSMELLMDIFHTKKQSLDKLLLVDIDGRTGDKKDISSGGTNGLRKYAHPRVLGSGAKAVGRKSRINSTNINEKFVTDNLHSRQIKTGDIQKLETYLDTHLLKVSNSYGGYGVYFPGDWDIYGDSYNTVSFLKDKHIGFTLQKYIQLPLKLNLDKTGSIHSHQVDIRSFAMLHHDRSLHTEIFGRSNVVGKACNASSGGLFCNVIVVPDSYYFDCQHELYDALLHCSPSDVESLSIILHNYMRQTMHVPYRQYTMSIVPYIMSLSGYNRIIEATQAVIYGLVEKKHTFLGPDGGLYGTTNIGIDMSVNPLPHL